MSSSIALHRKRAGNTVTDKDEKGSLIVLCVALAVVVVGIVLYIWLWSPGVREKLHHRALAYKLKELSHAAASLPEKNFQEANLSPLGSFPYRDGMGFYTISPPSRESRKLVFSARTRGVGNTHLEALYKVERREDGAWISGKFVRHTHANGWCLDEVVAEIPEYLYADDKGSPYKER